MGIIPKRIIVSRPSHLKYIILKPPQGGVALGTLPQYQGKGFAKRMVQIAVEMQDRDQAMYYAALRPAAWKLYERLGFEDLACSEFDLRPWGGNTDRTKLMIRHPKILD